MRKKKLPALLLSLLLTLSVTPQALADIPEPSVWLSQEITVSEDTEDSTVTEGLSDVTQEPSVTEGPSDITQAPSGIEEPSNATQAPSDIEESSSATQEPSDIEEPSDITEVPVDADETPLSEEEPLTGTESFEDVATPDPEKSGIFQNGALEGPQTIPGAPMLLSEDQPWREAAYEMVLKAWRQRASSVNVSSLRIPWDELSDFWNVCSTVLNDHPELFYAYYHGRTSSRGGYISTMELEYRDMSLAGGTEQSIKDFNNATDKAMAQIKGVTDDVEKALLLHDYLVVNCGYNWGVATNQRDDPYIESKLPWSAYGALVKGDAVCAGYSLAYQYLLKQAGIDSVYISSPKKLADGSEGMNHGWNAVFLNGCWYHVDTTWDDPVPNMEGQCRHHYFLVSDATLADQNHNHYGWTHIVDCTDTTYESDWVFLDTDLPFYRWKDSYYYVSGMDQTMNLPGYQPFTRKMNTVFRTDSLHQTGEAVASGLGQGYNTGAAVWKDGRLYLSPYYSGSGDRLVILCDLATGASAQAWRFSHIPTGVYPYSASSDQRTGLRYNAETREIEATSAVQRKVIDSFPASSFSSRWTEGSDLIAIAPGLSGGTAGVFPGSSSPEDLVLWAAFYRDGRLTAVRPAEVQKPFALMDFYYTPPLLLTYLDIEDLPAYDSVKLMLTNADHVPVCSVGSGT